MSAEESDKPNRIPEGLEKAIAELAKRTVNEGLDPGRVLAYLMRFLTAWNELTPEQREAVRSELRRRGVPRVAQRKPRRYGEV
jgi:hypothetical protein